EHTGDRGAVTAEVLRRRVDDDVGAVLDGAHEVRGRQCVVGEEGNTGGMGDIGDRGDVEDVGAGIRDDLGEEELRIVVDGALPLVEIGHVDAGGLDAELAQGHVDQVLGAAVEAGAGHDVVAGTGDVRYRQERRGLSGCGQDRVHAALEVGDAVVHDLGGRI